MFEVGATGSCQQKCCKGGNSTCHVLSPALWNGKGILCARLRFLQRSAFSSIAIMLDSWAWNSAIIETAIGRQESLLLKGLPTLPMTPQSYAPPWPLAD